MSRRSLFRTNFSHSPVPSRYVRAATGDRGESCGLRPSLDSPRWLVHRVVAHLSGDTTEADRLYIEVVRCRLEKALPLGRDA